MGRKIYNSIDVAKSPAVCTLFREVDGAYNGKFFRYNEAGIRVLIKIAEAL